MEAGPAGAGAHINKREISEDDVSPDPGAASEVRKRRPQSSSRGVANLTPEKLAKKRANDREAQRAIRERTKTQIETLERRIRELTSQQPYQELQQVLRQKEAVEAENAEIKKNLSTVLSIIRPIVGTGHGHPPELQYPALSQPYVPSRPNSSTTITPAITPGNIPSPNATVTGATWEHANPQPAASDDRGFTRTVAINRQRHDLARGLEMGPERLGFEFLLDGTQHINKLPNGSLATRLPATYQSSAQGTKHESHGGLPHSGERLRDVKALQTDLGPNSNDLPPHAIPVRNSAPTCPLDSILLEFLRERQKQAAEGVATPKLVGPAYPSVSSLLNPERSVHSHPLSKVFTDILATFPGLSTLPEQVATLYTMFLIMRWQISPTQENYDRLPEWMTPRPSQLFTPHPAWIDHVPWPKMRDRLVRDHKTHDYLLENFFIPFTTTLSLNWPYEDTDTLLSAVDSDELTINPVFERHLRRLENWSLGSEFAKAFPGLSDTYRLKTDGK